MDKDQAQRRADRICSFGAELEALEKEDILVLDEQQKTRLIQYHQTLLSQFSSLYDVDINGADKQLSWSMRIVSFLGALALSAAVFFFFYRFWGLLDTPAQVGILVAAPMLAVLAVDFTAKREKNPLFCLSFQSDSLHVVCSESFRSGYYFQYHPQSKRFFGVGRLRPYPRLCSRSEVDAGCRHDQPPGLPGGYCRHLGRLLLAFIRRAS